MKKQREKFSASCSSYLYDRFMGVGLVDPILKTIAAQLNATPAETTLLFTSYMLVTGVVMLFTGFLSSRIGLKKH